MRRSIATVKGLSQIVSIEIHHLPEINSGKDVEIEEIPIPFKGYLSDFNYKNCKLVLQYREIIQVGRTIYVPIFE